MNAIDVIEKSKVLSRQARVLKGLLKKRAAAQLVVERFDARIEQVTNGQAPAHPATRATRRKK